MSHAAAIAARWTLSSSTRRRTRRTSPCSRPNRPISWVSRSRGAAREGAGVVFLDADDRQGSALYGSVRRESVDVMGKDSSVAGLPLHVSRGRDSGKVDLIIIDTPANSKDIAMLAAEQADFVVIPVAPRGLDVHSVLQTVKQVQQIGRAHVGTPVTNAHLVCRLLLEKKNTNKNKK